MKVREEQIHPGANITMLKGIVENNHLNGMILLAHQDFDTLTAIFVNGHQHFRKLAMHLRRFVSDV